MELGWQVFKWALDVPRERTTLDLNHNGPIKNLLETKVEGMLRNISQFTTKDFTFWICDNIDLKWLALVPHCAGC